MASNVKLSNGIEMPMEGFGVFQVTDPDVCEQTVLDAIETGYRLIDTASSYQNEEAVGRAIQKSEVPRGELFITTKAYIQQMGYDKTMQAFEESLQKLGLDYLDLYLIHMPFGDYYGSWRAMEELYKAGRIRAIGVCNFMPDRLLDLCYNAQVTPQVNQIERHPHYQRSEDLQIMKELGVQPQAWAPFAEGKNDLFHNETLRGIGEKYGKTIAQVVLRWLLQRGVVCIPKSTKRERMEENFQVFDFTLSEEDMETIAALDTGKSCFFDHRDPAVVENLAGMVRNV